MKKFAFKSVRSKLTFWFVVLGLAPLFIGIVITYHQQVRSIEQETFDKLIAIRDLKVDQLHNWLTERTGDLKTTSTDDELIDLEKVTVEDIMVPRKEVTGIDLQDLISAGDPAVLSGVVDVDHILFVRVVDVIGDLAGNATQDYMGRPVADPYPTTGEGSGMDLTGVAIINTGVVAIEETSWGSVKSLFR